MYPWYIIADHTQILFGRGSRIGADTMIAYNDTNNLHRIHAVSFSTTEACDGEFVIADNSGRTDLTKQERTPMGCESPARLPTAPAPK